MSTSTTPLPWFRAYADMVDDERLKLVAFEDRWHYVALLCMKCAGLLDKDDPPELIERMVAAKMGLQLRELEAVIGRLAEVRLVDPETFQPLAWGKRQFQSDSSTSRVQKFRERKRAATCNDNETSRNVSETPPDTETDTEEEALSPAQAREDESDLPTFDPAPEGAEPASTPTAAGAACLALRRAGMPHTNPSDPRLLAALAAGVTETELADVVAEVLAKGGAPPGLAYVCTTALNRRRDAAREPTHASTSQIRGTSGPSRPQSALERTLAGIRERREAEAATDAAAPAGCESG